MHVRQETTKWTNRGFEYWVDNYLHFFHLLEKSCHFYQTTKWLFKTMKPWLPYIYTVMYISWWFNFVMKRSETACCTQHSQNTLFSVPQLRNVFPADVFFQSRYFCLIYFDCNLFYTLSTRQELCRAAYLVYCVFILLFITWSMSVLN